MSTLLRIDTSIRADASVTRAIGDTLQSSWLAANPGGTVVRRDLAVDPIPTPAWSNAVAAAQTDEAQRTPTQRAALALAAAVADEVLAADLIVVGAPLYNYGVSAHLKTWIDLLLADARFAPGTAALTGRPLALVVARGGGYGPGTPREGWDYTTPYLMRIFAEVMGADVTLVDTELTLAEHNPAMEPLRPLAAQRLADAHQRADEVGRELAKAAVTA
ncbi:FMN-dependent NADH-azoreductase [Pseudonocardia thermophila]|uniref:FMN dependent NADH:quinone oxidoreductase n=1 Tax=Pseudonocardia thermophila TaxID=1848 RepID=A0A1M6Q7E5_PSETH|nr:NAD(P)H-dependent oxidoreductase [Pseudonocardia thermophila]SHK16013.1 FMN-dependent NADH-azoreductase [Pseudonocardia thermophila]